MEAASILIANSLRYGNGAGGSMYNLKPHIYLCFYYYIIPLLVAIIAITNY